jgi:predicted TIM-barrel fold metal-dependent hydrolase
MVADAHCHFFSSGFMNTLGRELGLAEDAAFSLPSKLGWDPPGSNSDLAGRWIAELDRHQVSRAMLIASVPGDETSVADAVKAWPDRLVGAFMVNPASADAPARVERAFVDGGLSTVCLFPAMHHVSVDDARTEAIFGVAARHRRAVFVHCGVLSIGVRKKLGLASQFDLRLGDPLAVAAAALRHPDATVIIPHFGAGLFREALMAASVAPNLHLDTSSSNNWVKLVPNLTLADVFARALDVVGPSRLLFGTDSSFFPRGWQKAVCDDQRRVIEALGVSVSEQSLVFGGNFNRLFPPSPARQSRQ